MNSQIQICQHSLWIILVVWVTPLCSPAKGLLWIRTRKSWHVCPVFEKVWGGLADRAKIRPHALTLWFMSVHYLLPQITKRIKFIFTWSIINLVILLFLSSSSSLKIEFLLTLIISCFTILPKWFYIPIHSTYWPSLALHRFMM